jgi:hypothetical protein
MTKRFLTSLTFLLLFSSILFAGPKLPPDYGSFIGKRIFESPLNEWLEKNEYTNALEEFQSDGPLLFLKHYEKGYQLLFDINMTLNNISFYATGGRYKGYQGLLPFNLRFGMNRDSLYRVIDLRLEESEDNPYILSRVIKKNKMELIFNSKGLVQVNLLLNDTIAKANDKGYVRLVSNGKIVSGDCDSISGVMSWDNGKATYDGEWKNNLPHGKGYFKDQYDNWYKGEFKYGYFWGKGQLQVNKMYNYNGEFLLSRRHGKGNCQFYNPKGENYDGQWRMDLMSGLGKYSKGPKFYYYGNMANNYFNGQGRIVTIEGWLEGNFSNGLPDGFIKQYINEDNLLIEGNWVKGKKEGKFKLTDANKKLSYKQFKNDIEIIDK